MIAKTRVDPKAFLLLLTAMTALCAAGCGGSSAGPALVQGTGVGAIHAGSGFSLVGPGSEQTAGLAVTVEAAGRNTLVRVVADEALEAEALLFELNYDAGSYAPLAMQATGTFAALDDSLCLEYLDDPGVVSFAQVPLAGETGALTAGTVIAEVLFTVRPFAEVRTPSAVPVHSGALCPLTYSAATGGLTLYYNNPGDYDQNGIVAASDIVPLGRHYGVSGPFDYTTALSVVDGNDNGQIEVADLSAIGQNWDHAVAAFNFYGSDSADDVPVGYAGPSTLEPLGTVDLSAAEGSPGQDRLRIGFLPDDESKFEMYWARPVADGMEGVPSNLAGPERITQTGSVTNSLPSAKLALDYTSLEVPAEVLLDASASADVDGVLAFFEWDFEGDGLYDGMGTEPLISHTYNQAGEYAPMVRVTDNLGAWAVDQAKTITVTRENIPNIPPVADLVATAVSGTAPLYVGFMASGSSDADGYITKYEWDFNGDGVLDLDSGSDPTVIHTYETAGTFQATVIVTDDSGDSTSDSVEISVEAQLPPNEPPVAVVTSDLAWGYTPLAVNFNGGGSSDSDGVIVKYEWDFNGDGIFEGYGAGATAAWEFTKAGNYEALLRVTDDAGDTADATVAINVNCNVGDYAEWQMAGHDARNTCHIPTPGPATTELKWSHDVNRWAGLAPVINSQGVIICTHIDTLGACRLTAINADGTERWSREVDYAARDLALGPDGIIYYLSLPAGLLAFDSEGRQLWQWNGLTSRHITVGNNGEAYLYDSNKLVALSAEGELLWEYIPETGFIDYDRLAVTNSGILCMGNGMGVQHISLDGTLDWTCGDLSVNTNFMVGDDGTIYVHNLNQIAALTPRGEVLWEYTTPDRILNKPALAVEGRIIFSTADELITLDQSGGEYSRTELPLKYNYFTAAEMTTDSEGSAYFWNHYNLVSVDSGGDLRWLYNVPDWVCSPSVVIDRSGVIYLNCSDGKLYAIGDQAGEQPPEADLTASLTYGSAPVTVSFSAADSSVTNGDIDLYEWDCDGDGAFEDSSSVAEFSHEYTTGGEYCVTVRVTDDLGYQDEASVLITLVPDTSVAVWSSEGHDARHTGRSQFIGPETEEHMWEYSPWGYVRGAPVVAGDGTIYLGTYHEGEQLVCVDPAGTTRWQVPVEGGMVTSPALAGDGTIYAGSLSGKLYAVDPAGSVKWAFEAGDSIQTSPVLDDAGRIYFGCDDGKLYCLDSTGVQQWAFTAGYYIRSTPAIAPDGTVYFNCYLDRKLYALSPGGVMQWTYPLAVKTTNHPTVAADGTVYIGSDTSMLAINPDGSQRWECEVERDDPGPVALGIDGSLYFGADGTMCAVSPDGDLLWTRGVAMSLTGAAIDAGGRIYCCDERSAVYALSVEGELLWNDYLYTLTSTTPMIGSNGIMYIGNGEMLYAYGPAE